MRTFLVALLFVACRTQEPVTEVYTLDFAYSTRQHITTDEYEDDVPNCDRGPTCDEAVFFAYLDVCKKRDSAYSRRLCENDERNHYEWCLTFHESYDHACRELRPGDVPGPLSLCLKTCSDMAGAMNNYECGTGRRDCTLHTHYWRLQCETSCPQTQVLTTWGSR